MAVKFNSIDRMVQIAKERNISLCQLAKQCGIGVSTLNAAKRRGKQLRLPTIIKLCEGLELRLEEFFIDPPQN